MPKDETVYRGLVVDVAREHVVLPNGRQAELEIVRHPGGAAVVALDAQGRVCLLRQYRHAAGGWIWELPAGRLEPGEPPEETVRRELAEEAGRYAAHLEPLGRILSSPGVFNEVIHLYRARELEEVASGHEEHEVIETHWIAFEQALAMAAKGEITDAKTVVGLFRASVMEPRMK